jgi:hypothetical protein
MVVSSPTATWSWLPLLLNLTYWPRYLMFACTSSTTSPTMLPPSYCRRRGAPQHRALSHIFSGSTPFTNASIAKSHCAASFRRGQCSIRSMFSSFSPCRHSTPCPFQPTLPTDNALANVPPGEMISTLILALSRKSPDLGSLLIVPKQWMRIGSVGKSYVWRTTWIHSSSTVTTPSPSSKSLHIDIVMAVRLPCRKPSDLEQWAMRSSNWGGAENRKDAFGAIDFRISHQFRCYRKEDPPSRVEPFPVIIVIFILQQAFNPSYTHNH